MKLKPSDPATMLVATLIIEAAALMLVLVIGCAVYLSHRWF